MIGKLSGFTLNRDGTQNITVTVNADFATEYDELKDKEIDVNIKRYYKKRSLDANAYCWVIIDKIAEKTKEKKSDIYKHAIKEIGGVSNAFCGEDEAIKTLCRNWQLNGQGWMAEHRPSKKIPGYSVATLWYGSSVYNTKQMSDLIDSLIQEAEAQGISTITEKEKEQLLGKWTVKQEKKMVNE